MTKKDKLFVVVKSITVFFFHRQEMTKEKLFRSLFLLPVFLLLFTVFIAGAQGNRSLSDNAVDELFLLANVAYSIIPGVIIIVPFKNIFSFQTVRFLDQFQKQYTLPANFSFPRVNENFWTRATDLN